MTVKIRIHFRDAAGRTFKRTLSYVNPDAPNIAVVNCVNRLNSLTTNTVEDIFKILNQYLDEEEMYQDDTLITADDLKGIFNGTYQPVFDDDPITEQDFLDILNGDYSPVEDDFTADLLIF